MLMARQLWLLRHGEAEPHGSRPDPERQLTERGAEQSRCAGAALVALRARFDAVLTSPKVRALETARLAAAAWGAEPEVYEPLASGFDASELGDAFAVAAPDNPSSARLLIVGHEPDFSTTVAQLTGARIDLKKGGLAAVRLVGGGGQLIALMRPAEVARIASAAVHVR